MNDEKAKQLGKQVRQLLPEETIEFKIEAPNDMYIKYKDSDNKTTTIHTELPKDRYSINVPEEPLYPGKPDFPEDKFIL